MGNQASLPLSTQKAQEEIRALQPELIPRTQSTVVRATEEAPEPAARELAISAQLFHLNPRMIEFSMIEAVVRRGCKFTLSPSARMTLSLSSLTEHNGADVSSRLFCRCRQATYIVRCRNIHVSLLQQSTLSKLNYPC